MAKKKITKEVESVNTIEDVEPVFHTVIPTPIEELSVDFPSEGLNNMAKKINELVQAYNAKILRS